MSDKAEKEKEFGWSEDGDAEDFKILFPELTDEEIAQKIKELQEQKKKLSIFFKKFLVDEELVRGVDAVEKDLEIRKEIRRGYWERKKKDLQDDLAHLRDWEEKLVQDDAPVESLLQLETAKKLMDIYYFNDADQLEVEKRSDRQYLNDFLLQAAMVRNSQKTEQVLQEMKENSHPLRQFVWILGAGTISGLVVGFVVEETFTLTKFLVAISIVSVVLFLLISLFKQSFRSWFGRFGK